MSSDIPPAQPAATIVLLRDSSAGPPEIFMVERAQTMGFAAGAMVFPGGKVDAQDMELARDARLAPGFSGLEPDDAAARVAAIRETFEEAGVLVTSGERVPDALRDELRPQVARAALPFAEFLDRVGHRLDPDALTYFARWLPPGLVAHRRYDTRFYLAHLPPGEVGAHDGEESTRSHWITAAGAIARADAGETAIIFPTRRNLEKLAQYASAQALIDATRNSEVRLVMPQVREIDGQAWLCIDDDCGYPVTREMLATAARG